MTPEKVKELASHIQNNDDACSVCWEAASALSAYAALLEAKAPPEAGETQRNDERLRFLLTRMVQVEIAPDGDRHKWIFKNIPMYGANAQAAIDAEMRGTNWTTKVLPSVANEPQGWQPIETAPHMRKIMVSYLNALEKRRVVLACYYEPNALEMHDDYQDVGVWDEASGTLFAPAGWYEEHESDEPLMPLSNEPDFWQPLPSAPVTKGGGAVKKSTELKISDLTAEVAELRRDAERYRWLRDVSEADIVLKNHARYFFAGQWIETRFPLKVELDEAIDAARAALGEQP